MGEATDEKSREAEDDPIDVEDEDEPNALACCSCGVPSRPKLAAVVHVELKLDQLLASEDVELEKERVR